MEGLVTDGFVCVIVCIDAEHSPMLGTTQNYESESDTVVYPLLFKLVLELIAGYQNAVDCTTDCAVITEVLMLVVSAARKSEMTTICMYQQVDTGWLCSADSRNYCMYQRQHQIPQIYQ